MIDIYTEKRVKRLDHSNDLYFNLNTGNEEMTQEWKKNLLSKWMMPN